MIRDIKYRLEKIEEKQSKTNKRVLKRDWLGYDGQKRQR